VASTGFVDVTPNPFNAVFFERLDGKTFSLIFVIKDGRLMNIKGPLELCPA